MSLDIYNGDILDGGGTGLTGVTSGVGVFLPLTGGTVLGVTNFLAGVAVTGNTNALGSVFVTGTDTAAQYFVNQSPTLGGINSSLGNFSFRGWNGSSYHTTPVVQLRAIQEDSYTGGTYGTSLHFRTISTGGVGNNVKMNLHANGNVGIGTGGNVPVAKLHINNITTGNSFLIEDSALPDSSPFVVDASGNVGVGLLTPTEKLEVNGTIKSNNTIISYTEKNTNYTIGINDGIINCTGGTFTITLPTAIGVPGKKYSITNTGTGIITLATTLSQTIQGDTTQTIFNDETFDVMSTGSNWIVI